MVTPLLEKSMNKAFSDLKEASDVLDPHAVRSEFSDISMPLIQDAPTSVAFEARVFIETCSASGQTASTKLRDGVGEQEV